MSFSQILLTLHQNRILATACILFSIGFLNLMLQKNLIRKIIGLGIMDTATFLILTSFGYIRGRVAPILTDPSVAAEATRYINPVPTGLVLTGIVVSVSCTAFMLALAQRLYQRYHTLNLDELMYMLKKGGN